VLVRSCAVLVIVIDFRSDTITIYDYEHEHEGILITPEIAACTGEIGLV